MFILFVVSQSIVSNPDEKVVRISFMVDFSFKNLYLKKKLYPEDLKRASL